MITEFISNHLFMCSILLFGVVSIFMQWIMTLSLKGYVKASANMKTTKKKIMINLKNQFETIYGMDYRVRNVSAYVDKYLLKLRFMGITYSAWERVPALSAGVATLIAVGTAFYTYSTNGGTTTLIEILFSYGIVLACLFMFFHIFGIKSKKQQMQIQLVDYLENYLINRMIKNQESSKELKLLDASMEEAFMEGTAKNDELKAVILKEEKEKEECDSLEVSEQSEDVNAEKEIAASKEMSDMDLLEEFVQSFLA